ncbi:MAG: class I SAM-dependent methyltransferase [Nitrososphaerales archaeon]
MSASRVLCQRRCTRLLYLARSPNALRHQGATIAGSVSPATAVLNGKLVKEISGLPPGRALDIGTGEGCDALWLAEQGWRVTASDISQRALDRVVAAAERRGLRAECLHADALGAFEPAAFDVVSAPVRLDRRSHDGRAVQNLLSAGARVARCSS